MKFPKIIRHRKAEATIYGRTKTKKSYRVCAYVAGRRRTTSHATYSEALEAAEKKVREIAGGSQAGALTAGQARDALAAYELLQASGERISLQSAVGQFVEARRKLGGHSVNEAVAGFMNSVVTVKRITVRDAIEGFIAFRLTKTVAGEGRRPQLSEEHWKNTGYWLREFSATFDGQVVCDLSKQHLDLYIQKFPKAAPKTRNERRGMVRMFVKWCVEQDYLAPAHRLLEAGQLKHENADVEIIECYTASELRRFLEGANTELRPVLALAGLAGIRWKEICRLTWEDVFRVPDHIEVGALKAKTRSRRLVDIGPSLAQWLDPHRDSTGLIWTEGYKEFHAKFGALRGELKIKRRRNGLRHSFVSAHYALHADEGRTAQQAGNSPAMVHKNYKGLLTKADGEKWFAVKPAEIPINVTRLPAASE